MWFHAASSQFQVLVRQVALSEESIANLKKRSFDASKKKGAKHFFSQSYQPMESPQKLSVEPAGDNDCTSFQTTECPLCIFSSFDQDFSFLSHLTAFFYLMKSVGLAAMLSRVPLRPWKRHSLTATPAIP